MAVIGLLAYVVMIVWWPAAQIDPIRQPVRSFRYFMNLDNPFTVLFNGKEIMNTELPWYYQIYWFLISMPEFLLLSLGIGLVSGLYNNRTIDRIRQNLVGSKNQGIVMLILSIVIPLVYTMVRKPTAYDGVRHFLFLIPPLAIMAAYAVVKLLELANRRWLILGLMALILSSLFITFVDMIRLHPDEYIYFNRVFGGGVAGASSRFDLDYWGNSYKEAVEWMQINYPVPAGTPKLKVASCLFSLSTSHYLHDDRFEYIGTYHDGQRISGTPDIFLSSTRWRCDQNQSGDVIHEVTRMGAPLVKIIRVAK